VAVYNCTPMTFDNVKQNKGTILVVDDDDMVRVRLERLLVMEGYRVTAVSGGSEALAIYRERQDEIEVVVLDYMMPEMNGREVFDSLKEIDPAVKVLISSGYIADGETGRLLRDGALGFIQKPYQYGALCGEIEKAMSKK